MRRAARIQDVSRRRSPRSSRSGSRNARHPGHTGSGTKGRGCGTEVLLNRRCDNWKEDEDLLQIWMSGTKLRDTLNLYWLHS